MSFSKISNWFYSSTNDGIETLEEKYNLDEQLGSYMNMAKVLVKESAGTAGLDIANEQVKVFLTQFVPSIIINVTNIYGSKVGGKLLSEIQMTLASTLTGGLAFDSILNTVVSVVGLGSSAILGFSEDSKAINTMYYLLDTPFKEYATKLGYVSYIPKAASLIPFEGNQYLSTTADIIRQPLNAYKQVREIYRTPFNLLSRWWAEHVVQIVINETRDPYINNTMIPNFKIFVDDLLPKRDLASNFDPLKTQDEHTLDVTKKKINLHREQYKEFKRNSNILIYMALATSEILLQTPEVQDFLVGSIAGNKGKKMLEGARETYRIAQEACNFINDKHALSNTIAQWMQENFETLSQHVSNQTVKEHAELFKLAFCGTILTKQQLDIIKGKSQFAQVVEGFIATAYNYAIDSVSDLSSVKSGKEEYENRIKEIIQVIEGAKAGQLKSLLTSEDQKKQFEYRYIILINKRLHFKSKEHALPITPLLCAIDTGNYELVKVLVEYCETPNFKNNESARLRIDLDEYSSGVTALQFAIMKGYDEIAIYLIKQGADPVKPSIIGDATPLMIACQNGALDVIKSLLSSTEVKEQINAQGYRNRTALHYAMKYGHMKIAAELIDNGADLFLKDANGLTPIGLLFKMLEQENTTYDEFSIKFEQLLKTIKDSVNEKLHNLVLQKEPYSIVKNYLHLAINLDCALATVGNAKPWFNMLFEQNEIKLISKLMHTPHNSELIENEMWWAVNENVNATSILAQSMAKLNANEITVKLIELTSIKTIDDCFIKCILPEYPPLPLESLSQAVIDSIILRKDFNQLNKEILLRIFNHQIKNGTLESIKLILKKAPGLLDLKDNLSNTPLHYSLQFGRYEASHFLLEEGASVTIENKNKDTAYGNWVKNNTFSSKVLKALRIYNPDSNDPKDILKKIVALNMVQVNQQIEALNQVIARSPEKEYQQKLYETLLTLISQDNNDEIRNNVIAKILQHSYSDLGLFNIKMGTKDSLFLKTLLKRDYNLLNVFINALFNKYPYQREEVCQFFIDGLLSAPVVESELIKGIEVLLKLPDNKSEDNQLLLLRNKNQQLPSEIAFENKKYALMQYILELTPQGVTLAMMNYVLSKNLPCTAQVFNNNKEMLVQQLENTAPEETVLYLETIWKRPLNGFNCELFKIYFLNAPGIAINKFLQDYKNAGYFKKYPISMEQFLLWFNEDDFGTFVTTKFQFLSDHRKMELLELIISKGQMDHIIHNIIRANPTLLNLQLPELGNRTLLHMAIHNKNWELASYFMAKGCLVNLKDSANNTAYDDWIKASTNSLFSTSLNNAKIDNMIKSHSNSEQRDAIGRRIGAILIVNLYHSQELAKVLLEETSQEEKIKIIAEKILSLLNEPNPNVLNGMTLNDYQQAIRDLITELTGEYQITLEDIFSYKFPKLNGNTLLHQAISTWNKMVSDFILDYPVNLNLKNNAGDTLLHLTIKNGDLDLSKYFIEQGASTDLENNEKQTANQLIDSACKQNNSSFSFFKKSSLTKEQATSLMQLVEDKATNESSSDQDEVKPESGVIDESNKENIEPKM